MTVWTSFMGFAHGVGAVGATLLVAGFTAQGETARAVFYALVAVAFTSALLHRRTQRRTPAVVDLRSASSEVRTPAAVEAFTRARGL